MVYNASNQSNTKIYCPSLRASNRRRISAKFVSFLGSHLHSIQLYHDFADLIKHVRLTFHVVRAILVKFGLHAGKIKVIIQKEGEQQTALIMYTIIPAYFIYRGAGKVLSSTYYPMYFVW